MFNRIRAYLGYADAQFEVGADYFYDQDDDKALYWLMKAADQEYVKSYDYIATIFLERDGHTFEYLEWLQKAVDAGDVDAQIEMAYLYRFGKGKAVFKDTKKAIDLYEKAVKQGSYHAEMMLKEMRESGNSQ